MTLLESLWERYAAHVPYARTFVQLAGGGFRNDHVAFRSLDLEPIASLFEKLGWKRAGKYDLTDVHVSAIHLSKPGEPRIFVSELRCQGRIIHILCFRVFTIVIGFGDHVLFICHIRRPHIIPFGSPRCAPLSAPRTTSQFSCVLLTIFVGVC